MMLYHLLLQIVSTQLTLTVSSGQPRLLRYDLRQDVEMAVDELSLVASGWSLHVIVDEVDFVSEEFQTFCDKLLTQVPCLHLWAASCFHKHAPVGWHVKCLTRPLRSPPAVVREVQQDEVITERRDVLPYSERGVADHTDGPPVRRLYHRGQDHSGEKPYDCVTCGHEVANFLHSLRVPVNATTSTTVTTVNSSVTPPFLQWRDVLVLWWYGNVSDQSGIVTGLRKADIPVRVMKDSDIEDVATARSDVVWVADGYPVRGLERKVVVCLEPGVDWHEARLHFMSRCTSQLVIVSP